MTNRCPECDEIFDDALQITICPHVHLRDAETQARWEYGHRLLGNNVRMIGISRSSVGRCFGLSFDGVIHVEDLPGAYPADMFEITGELQAVPFLGSVS